MMLNNQGDAACLIQSKASSQNASSVTSHTFTNLDKRVSSNMSIRNNPSSVGYGLLHEDVQPRSHKATSLIRLLSGVPLVALLLSFVADRAMRWKPSTLVLYIFSNSDPEALNNLHYFVREGISSPKDGCDYLIVLQQGKMKQSTTLSSDEDVVDEAHDSADSHYRGIMCSGSSCDGVMDNSGGENRILTMTNERGTVLPGYDEEDDITGGHEDMDVMEQDLPVLPPNARYVKHDNECYDWGTIGWLISSKKVDVSKYLHFIFINSSVRGPFIPPHLTGLIGHWSKLLIRRLEGSVKLVGASISCEGTPSRGDEDGEWRKNPHVQSYLLATDRWDAIWYGEVGSTAAVLDAGYNIDSLMMRYQGVDWRNRSNWGCNGGKSPSGLNYYDGLDLDPYEVMFIKLKAGQSDAIRLSAPRKASKYQHWIQMRPSSSSTSSNSHSSHTSIWTRMKKLLRKGWRLVGQEQDLLHTAHEGGMSSKGLHAGITSSNHYKSDPLGHKAAAILEMLDHGEQCFDVAYYLAHNPDLQDMVLGYKEMLSAGTWTEAPDVVSASSATCSDASSATSSDHDVVSASSATSSDHDDDGGSSGMSSNSSSSDSTLLNCGDNATTAMHYDDTQTEGLHYDYHGSSEDRLPGLEVEGLLKDRFINVSNQAHINSSHSCSSDHDEGGQLIDTSNHEDHGAAELQPCVKNLHSPTAAAAAADPTEDDLPFWVRAAAAALWTHWVTEGQFEVEGRPFRNHDSRLAALMTQPDYWMMNIDESDVIASSAPSDDDDGGDAAGDQVSSTSATAADVDPGSARVSLSSDCDNDRSRPLTVLV
ncbi:hypothetical protein CEUSTIGMA_g10720.t1 [Chlamydomonas eustigma]|uniref:Uncharacterized protein n=1 Tax=Chlamydomonas eustigma TaxID=1157962 RepID=A0A250XJP6_9CHLO|nr:hypothetical protein CEUSTIGMA_g10720.t1 [Chlamydomonas eustigma]|eukprot:GAX83294.1 hypothetical protein CEUSTIGMA_g10720.t1 [Chlamydomonas eustigma]